jgi:membrane-bound lytic murein transglycosylase A
LRALAAALVLLAATSTRAELQAVAAPALSVACDDLDLATLQAALVQEINLLQGRSGPPLRFGNRSVSPLEYATRTLRPLYELVRAGARDKLCGALRYNFAWYRIGGGPVLFTAYHTPTVRGSLTADDTFRYPLYKRPPKDATQHSTAQILGGSLRGRGLELVWLADAYDVLALHVEGGAYVQLPDGKLLAVGTDGHNGQPYSNVSKLLIADRKLPGGPPPRSSEPGNPKARQYFATHPAELNAYWGRNPHFVYFKTVEHAGSGKLGALTPGRSIAVDADEVPMGAVVWMRAQKPVVANGQVTGWEPMERVVLGQDTGAGIRGARIDVYFGEDEPALLAAQTMSVQGEAYAVLAK